MLKKRKKPKFKDIHSMSRRPSIIQGKDGCWYHAFRITTNEEWEKERERILNIDFEEEGFTKRYIVGYFYLFREVIKSLRRKTNV